MARGTEVQPQTPNTTRDRRIRERRASNRRASVITGLSDRPDRRVAERRTIDRRDDLPPFEHRRSRTRHFVKLWGFAAAFSTGALLIGAISFIAAFTLREGYPFCGTGFAPCEGFRPYTGLVILAGLVRAFVSLRRRPWEIRRPRGFFEETREAIADAALGSGVLVLFTFFFREGFRFSEYSYSRLVFVFDWALATVLLIGLAVAAKATLVRLRERGHDRRKVVVIRDRLVHSHVQNLLTRFPELGYDIVRRIEVDPENEYSTSALIRELQQLVRVEQIDELVLLLPRISRDDLSQLVGVAELAKLDIRAVPELFGLPPSKVALGQMGNLPVLDLLQEPLPGGRRAVKRAIDVVVAFSALVLSLPFQAMIAVAVRLSSRGPVVIRQTRVGMDGRPFEFLKFRTMFVNVEGRHHQEYMQQLIRGVAEPTSSDEALFKMTDDPRVTPVGRWLRRYSLDELPQFINVLRGEMSIVGPRPALPFEVSMYEDWHRRRLDVRPGITGLWQVSGRSKIGFQDMVRLDINYIERWSPLLDLLIVLRTIPALLRGETG